MADRDHLSRARDALASDRLEEAVHESKRHLLMQSEDSSGLRVLFSSLRRLGRQEDACVVGRQLVKVAPTDFDARLKTARLELALGRPDRVVNLLAKYRGEDRAATATLAEAYEDLDKPALAASLRSAVADAEWVGGDTTEGNFRRLYFARQLLSLLQNRGHTTRHADDLIEALEEGRYVETGHLLKKWSEQVSEPVTQLAFADWFLMRSEVDRAASVLNEVSVTQDWAGAWENRMGDVAQARGDYTAARAHFRKATVLEPTDTNAWLDLARAEFVLGDRSAAIEACEKVVTEEIATDDEWMAQELLNELQSEDQQEPLEPGLYGLVWWDRGGGVLEVEASHRRNASGLKLTGNIGRQLEDAAHVAFQFVQAKYECFESSGVHLHFPGFRSPKDGGSAGALLGAILYGLNNDLVPRERLAVTGELTLSGEIRPVGGIREKITSAYLHGIDHVLLPSDNVGDLFRVPLLAKRSVEITQIRRFADLLSTLT